MEIPLPDVAHRPLFANDWVVVEVVYADDNWARVLITKDGLGVFRIHPERWDVSDLLIIGKGFWSQWGHQASFTDDIEIACKLAREVVSTIPRSEVMP